MIKKIVSLTALLTIPHIQSSEHGSEMPTFLMKVHTEYYSAYKSLGAANRNHTCTILNMKQIPEDKELCILVSLFGNKNNCPYEVPAPIQETRNTGVGDSMLESIKKHWSISQTLKPHSIETPLCNDAYIPLRLIKNMAQKPIVMTIHKKTGTCILHETRSIETVLENLKRATRNFVYIEDGKMHILNDKLELVETPEQ